MSGQDAPSRLPPSLARILRRPWWIALAAFAVGLLVFLAVWLGNRDQYDFYRADVVTGTADTQGSALPAPLPPDVAAVGDAPGTAPQAQDGSNIPAATIGQPAPPPPPPAPVQAPVPPPPTADAAPGAGDRATAEPLDSPAPRYPQDALRRGAEGTVRIEVTVAADGSVAAAALLAGSGNRDLDRAALAGVRRWTFRPATRGGQPVESKVSVPIEFRQR